MPRIALASLIGFLSLVGVLLVPTTAAAQAGGSLSGLVEDTTGGILPGVTVEAASSVLIEGTIAAFTDSAGRYTIINLRPGTYTVTFTLPGFNTAIREDVLLTGDSAVQINAELQVGAVEETVTVSGEAPVVDTQQVRRQAVVTRQMMDVLPQGRTLEARLLLIPGVRNTGMGDGSMIASQHGSDAFDSLTFQDGMRTTNVFWDIRNGWELNDAATAELTFETGGSPAEVQVGGVVQNAIPKEGGNTFSGTVFTYYGTENLQGDNRTAELKELIRAGDRLRYDIDFNPAFGGPIIEDKLWFFASHRTQNNDFFVADQFFKPEGSVNRLGHDITFGHAGEQAFQKTTRYSGLLRLTHQVTPRNKWRISFARNARDHPFWRPSATVPPESTSHPPLPVGHNAQLRWTSSLSNRWLVELGMSEFYVRWRHEPQRGMFELIPQLELTTGQWSGSTYNRGTQGDLRWATKASTSYVTGSHNFKTGIDLTWGSLNQDTVYFADTHALFFLAGNPFIAQVAAVPLGNYEVQIQRDIGVYAQDSWTIDRLTLNLGARYDRFRGGTPPIEAPAGTWVGARSLPALAGPDWHDGSVRFGVAYDLFGDGRTALKGNVNQYISAENVLTTLDANPFCCDFRVFPRQENRSWNDLDGNGDIVDRNNNNRIQFEEIGPSPQGEDFGTATDVVRLDPNLQRDGNWEYSVSLQHELLSGLSVTGGWYARDFTNQFWTDDRLVGPSNYTPFTFTGPLDPRLPNGGGESITGYNLNQSHFGIGRNRWLANSDLNDIRYTGYELVVDGRLPNGGFYGGSVTTEKSQVDTCEVDDPNLLRHCDHPRPFQTLFKVHGAYPLPGGVTISGFLQGMPGPANSATFNITSLPDGTPLTGGQSIGIDLIAPEAQFLPRQTNLDLRVSRRFIVGGTSILPLVDIFNLFNSNTTLAWNNVYGPQWQRITQIMRPRFARLGVEIDW